ncbi:TPA: conjugal transfer pilus assembly protein TraU [Escherichia coli]|nr:conjugal transfer pilus assembly protein TraU [Escherichia coli]HBB2614104.1 conjugal transfer pilus assembly protein TraU [Escherichia coli]
MKRSLWLLMLFLLAGHVPAASADSACEGRFVNPITDICWSCIFPLSLGSIKVSQGKVPDTANPSMPIQICPAPPPLFRRIGLAIGYWEPMALTDVTRSPGCMVNLGFSLPAFGKTAQGTAKKDEKQVNGAFYHVHWYKYPLTYWLNIITSLGCLEGGDLDIAYLSEIDPTWTDSSLTTILNPEAVIFANPIAQGACAADAIASAFNMPLDVLFWCAGSQGSMYPFNGQVSNESSPLQSRTESMSGQMSEDLSQQFAQYVMKHAPQDAEAILTNTSSPEIAERRRAMAWSFVQEQVQPGVDNAWRESRGDIGKGMESVPSGGGSQDIIADHQGHQAIIEQRTQDSNIRNDVKHQVDNMVTEYKGNIGDTQNSIHGEENIVDRQYSELKNNHKQEEIQQNNRYNEENKRQKLMPTPSEDALKQMVDDKKERLKGPL